MQGHHLHAFGAFLFLLLALEHVAQHQLGDGFLDGHATFLVALEGVLQGVDEEPDVAHAEVRDLVAGGVLANPVFIVDVHHHAAQRGDGIVLRALLAHGIHEALEALQAVGEAAVQVLGQAHLVAGGVHRNAAFGGVVAELLQGGGTDLPARHVDHAEEGVVVVRVHQQAEVGHQVLHFLAAEEAGAAG
ncbi:hypothetical protein D9M71_453500 [compost metagenome]